MASQAAALRASLLNAAFYQHGVQVGTSRRPSGEHFPSFSGRQLKAGFVPHRETPSSQSRGRQLTVRASKGSRYRKGTPGMPAPPRAREMPDMGDDDNPKFLLFIRAKEVPFMWYPMSMMTGGSMAKMAVQSMSNDWFKNISVNALTKDIGNMIYREESKLRKAACQQYSILRSCAEFEYGYKIVDQKKKAEASLNTNDIVVIPPKEELVTVVDKVKGALGLGASGGKKAGDEEKKGLFGGFKFGGDDGKPKSTS